LLAPVVTFGSFANGTFNIANNHQLVDQTITSGITSGITSQITSQVTWTLVAPSNIVATAASPNKVILSWNDNGGDESDFRIERKIGGPGTWAEIAVVSSGTTTYDDTSVGPLHVSYYYRVRAHRQTDDAYSGYSNEAEAMLGINIQLAIVAPKSSSYLPGENIAFRAFVYGKYFGVDTPIFDVQVILRVRNPSGYVIYTGDGFTDNAGLATSQTFATPLSADPGEYLAHTEMEYHGSGIYSYSPSQSFIVTTLRMTTWVTKSTGSVADVPPFFLPGEDVVLRALVHSALSDGFSPIVEVTFEVQNPSGSIVYTGSVLTEYISGGNVAAKTFSLPQDAMIGTYRVRASLTYQSISAIASTAFSVSSSPTTTSTTTIQETTQTVTSTFTTTIATTITGAGGELKLQVTSNSTITNLAFDSSRRLINFTVSGTEGTRGFCYVLVAKELLDGRPVVLLDFKIASQEMPLFLPQFHKSQPLFGNT